MAHSAMVLLLGGHCWCALHGDILSEKYDAEHKSRFKRYRKMIYLALLILIITLLMGVPVPVSFMASSAWLIFFGGPDKAGYDSSQLLPYGFQQMSSIPLIAVALFIIAGSLMEKGKIGEKLIDLVDSFCGDIKGGLGVVGTVSCAVFGSITGAACATLSCIGSIMFPRFEKAGYPRGHYAALMANASLLGLLIPPNGTLIIFAWISGQSVLACFLSTVSAGILVTILISLTNIWLLRKSPSVLVAEKRTRKQKVRLFMNRGKYSIPALFLPVIVLGTIYGGMMTPTEASALAVVYAILVGMFVYKGLNARGLCDCLFESGVTTGVIMVMLFCVSMLSRLYILEDLPNKVL
jgi:tripartite ATP-independent transporter DctM subunit